MNITKFIKKITMSTMSNEKALKIIIRNINDLESLGDTDTITKLITKAAKKDFKRLESECFFNSLLNNIISQLKRDPKVMLYAVKQDPNNLNYAKGEALTEDVIKTAIDSGYKFNDSSSYDLLANPKVMMYAVKQDPNNLNYVPNEFLTDEMIDFALSTEKYVFDGREASYNLRHNPKVMLYAVKQNPNNLNYVLGKALTDEIIDFVLSTGKYIFDGREADRKLKQNPKVMLYAVKQDPNNLNYVEDEALTDEMIDIALSTEKYVFDAREASYKLIQNPKVMLYAVKQNPNNLNYVLKGALTDEVIKAAYDNGFWELKNNNKNNEDISIIIAKLRKTIELKHSYFYRNTVKMIEYIKEKFFYLTEYEFIWYSDIYFFVFIINRNYSTII